VRVFFKELLAEEDPAQLATLAERMQQTLCVGQRPLLSQVEISSNDPKTVIVALGDSITNRFVDDDSVERGWPATLAKRLHGGRFAVVNAGISGNRLLQSNSLCGEAALARLDRDVLSVPGAKFLVVLEGINDIGMSGVGGLFGDAPPVEARELISAYAQIIARAHEHGIKVLGGTLLPFAVAEGYGNYYSAEKEKVRQAVNAWILAPGNFDGAIDFDQALRDPAHPLSLAPQYDSGDHLHPNALGYEKMGGAIHLPLFH